MGKVREGESERVGKVRGGQVKIITCRHIHL